MTPEVREFIKQAGLCRSAVEQMAAMLPEDDLELDTWISEAIADGDSRAFHLIVFAALTRERPVDARHLSTGVKLAGGPYYIAAMALRVHGDMPEYLLDGLHHSAVHRATHAMALTAIAIWCDERRGGVYPEQLIPEARILAQRFLDLMEVDPFLIETAMRANDAALLGLIRKHYPHATDAQWQNIVTKARNLAEIYIDQARKPILSALAETPVYGREGGTIRRAVPRIGRNEPCHCGSGKKYKHCHHDSDRERLQQSSEVAGLTRQELSAAPEHDLTFERLKKLSSAELARINSAAVPRHLMGEYFFRLALVDVDQAAANLEKLGYEDDLEDAWFVIMFSAVRAVRKDIGERLMNLRAPFGLSEEDLRLSQRSLLALDEPAKWLRLIQAAALKALKTENAEELLDVAYSVTHSDASALGLILYRGVLPFIPPNQVKTYYQEVVLPLRERLELPSDDPLKELLDNRSIDTELALREAEETLEAKRREVRDLKETLDQVQKELTRKERQPAPDRPAPALTEGANAHTPQLREKLKRLESDLKERHSERNTLQRRLEMLQTRFNSLAEIARSLDTARSSEPDDEETLLLPQEAEEHHPLRLIEFPRNFLERLNEFPHYVARGTMAVLGRLAGGDPAAFNGAKFLKGAPNVMRQRVGIDFRLLFRLHPDRIQVIDLIPRQDLERKIKTLK